MESPFKQVIRDRQELREVIRPPSEMVVNKELGALDAHCVNFMRRSPFLLIATSNATGRCDVSPRGDAPGFVQVLSNKYIAIPDRPGNRRLDSMDNILDNPHIGMLFVIPGMEETLRVNGKAWIVRDEAVLGRGEVQGKVPHLAIGVEVEGAFLHCAKAFKRSRLWQPDSWPDTTDLPSIGQMLIDHSKSRNRTAEEIDELLKQDYAKNMY